MSIQKHLLLILALAGAPAWPQVEPASSQSAEASTEDRMVAPAPVSGEGYSLAFAAETPRTNYLSVGLGFSGAYDDNISAGAIQGVSDESYSVWPRVALQQSRSRLLWELSYSPGFTFYQHASSLNQDDHDLGVNLKYRFSPHVTLSLRDSFQKTSTVLSLFEPKAAGPDPTQRPSDSIVAPVTDRISNFGNAMITYQFRPNAMIGGKGTLSQLWYPNSSEARGLFDSTAQAAGGFYTHRLSGKHYIGVNYDFQRLLARPLQNSPLAQSETQTQSLTLSYTLYLRPTVSLSILAGPEYSDTLSGTPTTTATFTHFRMWSPAAGASFGWQGARTSLAASYSRRIAEGGGLSGASRSNSADASIRRQLSTNLTVGVEANYAMNDVLGLVSPTGTNTSTKGHTVSGSASLQHSVSEHLSLQLGYTRLHQSYSNIAALSLSPNRNRAWVSLSYQFTRPLGR
jgi:hypothetical protein